MSLRAGNLPINLHIMRPPVWSTGLLIAILYGGCSASMAFANKAVLTAYNFNYPIFLVSVQMLVTICALEILRLTEKTSLVRYTLERGISFLWPSVLYSANCVLSLSALSGMNIPMYGVIKRCAPAVVLLMGIIVLKHSVPSGLISLSITMMTVGCIAAGYGDLSFHLTAYAYGLCSVFSQAGYLLLVQRSAQNISATELLHLNSCNTFPILLLLSVVTGEFRLAVSQLFGGTLTIGFHVTFALVILFGCFLNYLLFLCTTHNSALTTSVVGAIKTVGQTIVGFFTFGGVAINLFTLSGITMNITGGLLYTYVKYKGSQAPKTILPIHDGAGDKSEGETTYTSMAFTKEAQTSENGAVIMIGNGHTNS